MGIGKDFSLLMDALGYRFTDNSYLENALTHTSYTNEMRAKGFRALSNEALEFLGDAVLQIVISEELFYRYGKQGEGALTKMRQRIVCESTLASVAKALSLGEYLNIGTGEESIGLRSKPKALADALEAVIAAIYIDDRENGHGANFRPVVLRIFECAISDASSTGSRDYKTMLQQFVEKNPESVLAYEYEERGPEHKKEFSATAYINNNRVGCGIGSTKRAAEMQAARAALMLFGLI
ncbi:MAG: ribonuclease III [Clostridia bacterium]|nr:ribonuclease III [Clostridia bacterium]